MNDTPEFSRPQRAHEIGGIAKRLMLEAEPHERAALAARFLLLSLDRLTAALEIKREAKGIRVVGQVHGAGNQACVASAEPVPFLVTERIDLLLAEPAAEAGDVELAANELDTEPLVGDIIDLGEIAAQAFALGLNPYPRIPGRVAGIISEDEAVLARSPFAVLKKD